MSSNFIKPIKDEELSQFLIEATPGLGWIAGPDGLCYNFNSRWLNFTGRALQQEIGNGWADGVHPLDLQRCLDIYSTHLKDQTSFEMKYRLKHHSGQFRWIIDCGQSLFNKDGSFAGFLGSCQDIQESVSETETRENSLKLFQEIIESAPDFIGSSDVSRKSTYHNRVWRGVEPLGKVTNQIVEYHPKESLKKIAEEGFVNSKRYGYWRGKTELIINENGANVIIPVAQTIIAHKDSLGVTTHFSTIMRDIREELRKEAELVSFNNAVKDSALVSITDTSGKIIEVNEHFVEISGYSRQELIGKDHRLINSGYHTKEFIKSIWDSLNAGLVWRGEIQNRKKNGEIYWVQSFITPIFGHNGLPERFLSIRFDVTEIRNINQRLTQSSKMSELGQMSSGIAHEINNPLAIIQGRTEILIRILKDKNKTIDLDAVLKHVESIEQTSTRIDKIVASLKTFARDGSNDPYEIIPLKLIIDETFSFCRDRFQNKNVKFDIDQIPSHLDIECKPTQVSQVLLNLLNNSIDAICDQAEKWISIKILEHAHDIEIMVTDSGKGIPEHLQKKILEPFFTTKEIGKGTGLGLSISVGILKSHNGTLKITTDSKNTQFVIQLPKRQNTKSSHTQDDKAWK